MFIPVFNHKNIFKRKKFSLLQEAIKYLYKDLVLEFKTNKVFSKRNVSNCIFFQSTLFYEINI